MSSAKKSRGRDDRDNCRDDDRDDGRDHKRAIVGTNGDDTLTGTSGNDSIYGGEGNDRINGGAGNDYIDGGKGNDYLEGGSGNDRISAGSGVDTIVGGAGNDYIDGGRGIDVAVFSGNFRDYKLTLSRDGGHTGEDDDDHSAMTVHDLRSGSPDGVDVLKNVEILKFADGEYRDGHFYPNSGGNVAPVATADTLAATEDTPVIYTAAQLLGNDTDADGDTLAIASVSSGTGGTAVLNTDGTVTFTPNANFNGAANFTYSVSDGTATSNTATVTVNVAAVNDAPVAVADALTAIEDTAVTYTAAQLLGNDTDVDGNTLAIASVSSGTGGTAVLNANGTVTFTPTANFNGAANFTYSVSDGTATSNTATVTVNVAAVNDAPVAVADAATAVEAGGVANGTAGTNPTGNVLTNDPDVDSVANGETKMVSAIVGGTVGGASVGAHGTLTLNADGSYTYAVNNADTAVQALNVSQTLNDSFTYTVADAAGATSSTTLAVTIQGSNDAAVISPPTVADVTEDATTPDLVATGIIPITDADSPETFSFAVLPVNTPLGTLVLLDTSGNYTYTVANGAVQSLGAAATAVDTFTVTSADGTTKDVSFTIHGTNDAPVLAATGIVDLDTARPDIFRAVTGQLSTFDVDTGATLTYEVAGGTASNALADYDRAQSGTYGTLYLNSANGKYTFVYSAAIDALVDLASANESFAITVSDEWGASDSKPLTINLTGANDASVISGVGPFNYTVSDPAKLVAPSLTLSDADNDRVTSATVKISTGFSTGDVLSWDPGTVQPDITANYDAGNGLLTITGSGTLAEYKGILDSVTFYASIDGAGGREIAFTVFDGAVQSATAYTSNLSLLDLSTSGFRLPGVSAGDASGFSVSGAGDVNRDGYADFIIGAPWVGPSGAGYGSSYVVYGRASGFATDFGFGPELPLSSLLGPTGFSISGENSPDRTGFSVKAAGDVNGDGFSDVIIGAPYSNQSNGLSSGVSYVVFGRDTNAVADVNVASLADTNTNGFSVVGGAAWDFSGYSVSGAGDVNGDGFADVIIGAPQASTSNTYQSGAAYVLFGHATPFANLDLSALAAGDGFSISGVAAYDWAGASVSDAGDVNGDGFSDLIIGTATPMINVDPVSDLLYGTPASASAYVVFGSASGFGVTVTDLGFSTTNLDLSTLVGTNGFRLLNAGTGVQTTGFGNGHYAVRAAGDVNGDGYGDLIIGAPSAQQDTLPAGMSYVVFGTASGFGTLSTVDLTNLGNEGFRISAVGPHNDSGYGVSAAGDVNGDGFADLIVASSAASPHTGDGAGESYVIFGAKFITTPNTQVGSDGPGTPTTFLPGTTANDIFIAGQGDATMIGGGGVDSFSGGAGNDTLHLGASASSDSSFLKIDGGGGFDTLVLDGSGMTLDLTTPGVASRVQNIERIDLGGHGNTLALNIHDVLNMSENSNTLQIVGGANDSVNVVLDGNSSWTPGADQTIGGVIYHTYINGLANLLIDSDISVPTAFA